MRGLADRPRAQRIACNLQLIPSSLSHLDVFYGDLTVARAYVYARLPRTADCDGLTIGGTIRGPRCLHAETLPISMPLVDLGPGPSLLARATIPDPVFWSPDLPAIYDMTVNLLRGSEIIGTTKRQIGLRALGVEGRNLLLEGKGFVLRGVFETSTTNKLPRDWRAATAAYVTSQPSDNQLEESSQWGAWAIVELPQSAAEAVAALLNLAHYPAVAIAITHGGLPDGFAHQTITPNVLLAQYIDNSSQNAFPWAQLIAAPADPDLLRNLRARFDLPLVAVRKLHAPLPISDARAACDALQRELAPIGQFAGYIV